ncbi:TraX family protein [Phytopseudomonas punonensis]|uniref:TraX protein n=1 Tax=Phytopseudomonas punonensis TaxID=1220495 RepID=A0A1M7HY54_9GAMM|nr:TraX family protein [Pseudomonas punonensis]SHM33481.1 TraX protein [Pseudomonas punonensis]
MPSFPSPRHLLPDRDAALDLIKWLALLTMLIDHLRHAWPSLYFLYVPGRLAFPLFCLAIAANIARPTSSSGVSMRYLGWLLLFSLVSEWPYRLLVSNAESLNVMPTLVLGLLIANAVQRSDIQARWLGAGALAVAVLAHEWLMFGAFGALLPAAFLLALRGSRALWLLPMVCCLAANYWAPFYADAARGDPFAWSVLSMCFFAPLLGLLLLRQQPPFAVPPVRRWAYVFYPAHFLLLVALRSL